jgi:hypothetical protein
MTATHTAPTDAFSNMIVTFLTPMFLTAVGGDLNQAHAVAIQTVNAYTGRDSASLLLIAQSIAFGLAVLSSISLSMEEDIPINLMLRLCGNAVSLHRAGDQCRRALAATQPEVADHNIDAAPAAAPAAMAERPAGSERRIAEADPTLKLPSLPNASPRLAPRTRDEHHRAAWSSAMTDVANEITAELAGLPQAERRAAGLRVTALNTTASHLISGIPTHRR